VQNKLNKDIDMLIDDIQAAELRKQVMLNATQDRIDFVRDHQKHVQMDILDLRKNISAVQLERAQHHTWTSHEQGELLAQIAESRRQNDLVRQELKEQTIVQLERDRLADQAREVVRQREELESQRVNCSSRVQLMDLEIAATQKQYDDDTAELKRCQDIDAENQELQQALNRCIASQNAGG